MRNEINLFDMLLAKKLGGGESVSPVVFTATQWSELPDIFISHYFPASTSDFVFDIGILEFTFNGVNVIVPVTISNYEGYKEITGGVCAYSKGAVISIIQFGEWDVAYAFANLPGSWTDITQAVKIGASDIKLTLFK